MNKLSALLFPIFILTFLFSTNLAAQETTVSVKVKKDGKVTKDTTYTFEDEAQAKHALMMMEMMVGDDEHMVKVHKSKSEAHAGQTKTMVFVSEDGKTTEIKEMSGDSLVWVSEETHHGDHEGENVKIIKYKIEGDDDEGTKVVVVKSEDGETFDIIIDEDIEDEDGNVVKTKEIKVIVSEEKSKEQ